MRFTSADLPNDLKSLTSFRFFAAFWVFLFHLRARIDQGDNFFWDIIEDGARGVDFFFILSGFIILHVYETRLCNDEFSLFRYLMRRFSRIYPLHLVMTIAFVILAIMGNDKVVGAVESIFLMHAWGTTDGLVLNGPSWTIAAEMFAYILFGLIVFQNPTTLQIAVAFVISAIVAHAISLHLGKTSFLHLTWDFGVFRIIPLFILGMLLRRVVTRISTTVAGVFFVLGAAMLFWVALGQAGYEILVPFALLILAGARLSDIPFLPTNGRFLVYLGEISYSTYMIHMLLILVWFEYLPELGVMQLPWPLVCPILIFLSILSYHLIEKPSRHWLNQSAKMWRLAT